jgi:hypothetical protein
MRSFIIFLFSQSILIAFIAGLVRFNRIGKSYRPFFILLAIGVITELVNRYLIRVAHITNATASNTYALVEWLIIAWQFHVWGLLRSRKKVFYALLIFSSLVWVVENLVFDHIRDFSPYFRFFDAFLIVLLSVNKINFMITHDNRNLLRRPDFLICIGFIIYFIYKIIYEWAYQTSLFGQSDITTNIIMLFGYINALTNIIFAIALLLIPAPQKFTLR